MIRAKEKRAKDTRDDRKREGRREDEMTGDSGRNYSLLFRPTGAAPMTTTLCISISYLRLFAPI